MNKIIIILATLFIASNFVLSQSYGVLYDLGNNDYALQNVTLTNNVYNYGSDRKVSNLKIGSNVVPGITKGNVIMSSTCSFRVNIQNGFVIQPGINFSRDALLQIKHDGKISLEINKNSDTYVDGFKLNEDVIIHDAVTKEAKVKIAPPHDNCLIGSIQPIDMIGFKMLESNISIPTLMVAPYQVFLPGHYNKFTDDKSMTLQVTGPVRTSGLYLSTSDERLKSNIGDLDDRLSDLYNLTCGTNDIIKENNKKSSLESNENFVVSLENMKEYFPELILEDKDGSIAVDYIGLIPILVETIKLQQNEIMNNDKMLKYLNDKFIKLKK